MAFSLSSMKKILKMFIEKTLIIVSGLFIFTVKAKLELENVCINTLITSKRYRQFITSFEEAIGRKLRLAIENKMLFFSDTHTANHFPFFFQCSKRFFNKISLFCNRSILSGNRSIWQNTDRPFLLRIVKEKLSVYVIKSYMFNLE